MGIIILGLRRRIGPVWLKRSAFRSSSNENFVYLTFTGQNGGIRIEAKQLYGGQRYYFGRLTAGRFKDFWKMNGDISIRGQITSLSPPKEFAIEPIGDDQVDQFWRQYVRTQPGEPSPSELMSAAGLKM